MLKEDDRARLAAAPSAAAPSAAAPSAVSAMRDAL